MTSWMVADTTALDPSSFWVETETKEDTKSDVVLSQVRKWISTIKPEKPLHQNLTVDWGRKGRFSYFGSTLSLAANCFVFTRDRQLLSWLTELGRYLKATQEARLTQEEDTAVFFEDEVEVSVDAPRRKKIALKEARKLALVTLYDAEKKRHDFAEEEAKRLTATWEE